MALLPVSYTTHSYASEQVGSDISPTRADFKQGSPGMNDQVTVSQAARDASTAARNLEASASQTAPQDNTVEGAKTTSRSIQARIASDAHNPVTELKELDQAIALKQHEEKLASEKTAQSAADVQGQTAQQAQQGTNLSVLV